MLNSQLGAPYRGTQLLCTDKFVSLSVYVEQSRVASFIEDQSICEQGGHGGKTWRCAVCGKCLMKKCDLVRHVESFHVVTDPYSCEFCSLSQFKTIRALQRHMNTVHK